MDLQALKGILSTVKDPESGRSVMDTEQVRNIEIKNDAISFTLELTTHSAPLWDSTIASTEQLIRQAYPSLRHVRIDRAIHVRKPVPLGQLGVTAKSVIAVGSGKGGVGKSTIAATLAQGLHRHGCTVGLMDADVYGPSIPHLLGLSGQPQVMERPAVGGQTERKIRPLEWHGMRVMSMGFFVPPEQAVVWRGPMLHGAITQFLRDTDWGDLDYLIIDMPPGTGDIALTLSQLLPLTGAVVVCTPQDVALLDAVKAIAMFRTVKIPILGMVENMSGFACPHCGTHTDIFGCGGAERRATDLNVPFLGGVPINLGIRVSGDEGRLNCVYDDPVVSQSLNSIVLNLVYQIADQVRNSPSLASLPVL